MKNMFFSLAFLAIFSVSLFAQDDFSIDTKKSVVRWEGKKVVGGHWGNIDLQSGTISTKKGRLSGGNFVINMKTIVDMDLKEEQGKSKLEGHLMSDDFFAVEKFPTSTFKITKVTEIKKSGKGKENYKIKGDLTIKGITHSINFPAVVEISNNTLTAKAKFSIDRLKWDVKYNSGNFFKDLGDKMILDDIFFNISLSATK